MPDGRSRAIPKPARKSPRWTSFICSEALGSESRGRAVRGLEDEKNPKHRARVEHNQDTLLVPRHRDVDGLIAQGFAFVGPAHERRRTPRTSSSCAGATEAKNKLATHQHPCGEVLVHVSDEDGHGWTVIAIDRKTREWAVAQRTTQRAAAVAAYDHLYK